MVLKIDWKLIWLFIFKVGLDPIKHLGVGTLGPRGFVKIQELTSAKQDQFIYIYKDQNIGTLNLKSTQGKLQILHIKHTGFYFFPQF